MKSHLGDRHTGKVLLKLVDGHDGEVRGCNALSRKKTFSICGGTLAKE